MENVGSCVEGFHVQVQHGTQKDKERKDEKTNRRLVWEHQQASMGLVCFWGEAPREKNVNDKAAARWWWILESNYKMEKG